MYKVLIFIWFLLELNVFEESCLDINKCIICGKEAFLINDLLEDMKCLRQEIDIKNPSLQLPYLWKGK